MEIPNSCGSELTPLMATFIITRKCTIACPMCLFNCGPHRQETLPQDLALRTLDEINRLNIKYVGITGGEPFLEFRLMKEIAKRANCYGMKIILVTNSHWALTKEIAIKRLSELQRIGIERVQISVDDQHQLHIPLERIYNVAQAAKELGFKDIKLLGSTIGNTEKFKFYLLYLQEFLGLRIEGLDVIDGPRVSHQYYEDPSQMRYSIAELENAETLNIPIRKPRDCLMDLMIDINGDVYPCCNNFVGRLGNLYEMNLGEIHAYTKYNMHLQILNKSGPIGLARFIDEYFGTNFCNGRYASWCELCARIFQKSPFKNMLVSSKSPITNSIKLEKGPAHSDLCIQKAYFR